LAKDDAFLQAIIEDPEDDAPRLVYADWLEEHGDPRAEFIRVQCELASLGEDDDRRPALIGREQELLAKHDKAWLGKLKFLVKEHEYRRGFVEWVSLPGREFLTRAEKLFGLAPIRALRLTHLGMGKFPADQLAATAQLARLDALELAGVAGDERIATILRSPHLKGITRLQLDEVRCGDRTLEALWAGALPRLTALELIGDELSASTDLLCNPKVPLSEYSIKSMSGVLNRDGVMALARAKNLAGLTLLDLRNSSAQVPGATAIASSKVLTKLQVLGLKGCAIGVHGMQALAKSSNLAGLTTLDVATNKFGVNGLRAIVSAKFEKLTSLNLANNDLDDRCVPLLRQWSGLARLRHLNLADNKMSDTAMAELLSAPELARLRHLDLEVQSGIVLGPKTAELLLNAPHFAGLQSLKLGYDGGLSGFKKKLQARFGKRVIIE
jgi:uncharacterized protein (TIGR02996 family)